MRGGLGGAEWETGLVAVYGFGLKLFGEKTIVTIKQFSSSSALVYAHCLEMTPL